MLLRPIPGRGAAAFRVVELRADVDAGGDVRSGDGVVAAGGLDPGGAGRVALAPVLWRWSGGVEQVAAHEIGASGGSVSQAQKGF